MQNQELLRQLQSIRSLIAKTNVVTGNNIELQKHWGRYLCVLAAGFLENAISEVYIEFVKKASSPQVSNFARRTLENIQNPKSYKFIETARAFSPKWGDELEKFFNQNESRKDAIDSIINNRNLIAHGKHSAISVARVKEYLDKSVEVIEFIEKQCSN